MYDQYLGDGVHASFDGYSIVLDLRGHNSTTRIVLEAEVFDALVRYRSWLLMQAVGDSDGKEKK